jgi:hypothetical protein
MPISDSLLQPLPKQNRFIKLLLIASIFHIAITCLIYFSGRFALFANLFNANGIMVNSDSAEYLTVCIRLKALLYQNGWAAWFGADFQPHTKLYSLSYVIFGWIFGDNILSFAPLNLFYYLAVISLIFKLGEEVFDRQTALIAAYVVACWPSFLIHTTQLFRDPAFIAATLLLVLLICKWLTRIYDWREAVVSMITGIFASLVLWQIRDNMWELTLAIAFSGLALLFLRQFLERQFLLRNTLCAVSLLVCICLIPHDFERKTINVELVEKNILNQRNDNQLDGKAAETTTSSDNAANENTVVNRFNRFTKATALRISAMRYYAAINYGYAASSIDADVQFLTIGDVIRYVPRALVIGFFAPFPNMWFAGGGSMGFAAKLLSGVETFLMWMLEAFAVYGLWHRRRQISAWLLFLIAAMGVTVLSIVVVNLGALYRMRYAFWILLVILGAKGLSTMFFSREQTSNKEMAHA